MNSPVSTEIAASRAEAAQILRDGMSDIATFYADRAGAIATIEAFLAKPEKDRVVTDEVLHARDVLRRVVDPGYFKTLRGGRYAQWLPPDPQEGSELSNPSFDERLP